MAKIDNISFARLISRITAASQSGNVSYDGSLSFDLVGELYIMVENCTIEPPVRQQDTIASCQVDALLAAIQKGFKIEAIKVYRTMTGHGLKEAKEAVELYWPICPPIGDILK